MELESTDSEDEEETSDSDEESDCSDDDDDDGKITEHNLKLPGHKDKKRKVCIQVVDQQGE